MTVERHGLDKEFVLGTAQLRSSYGVARSSRHPPLRDDSVALLRAAGSEHVDALDTAPAYGEAESTVGESSWAGPVHTKIERGVDPRISLQGSLGRLRRNHIDVLYVHDAAEVLRPDSPVIDAAHRLVGVGVGALGVSVYEVDEFDAAVADERIDVVQVPLNVLDRRIDAERIALANARGVRVYARSLLLQGLLAAAPDQVDVFVDGLGIFVSQFRKVAHDSGRSPLEVAIGWVRAMPGLHGVVLGAESVPELRGLVAAVRSEPLDPAVLSVLGCLPQPARQLVDPRRWKMVR